MKKGEKTNTSRNTNLISFNFITASNGVEYSCNLVKVQVFNEKTKKSAGKMSAGKPQTKFGLLLYIPIKS